MARLMTAKEYEAFQAEVAERSKSIEAQEASWDKWLERNPKVQKAIALALDAGEGVEK